MTAAGRNFYVPIADNDTSEGKEKQKNKDCSTSKVRSVL